jgi:hypothetical protein
MLLLIFVFGRLTCRAEALAEESAMPEGECTTAVKRMEYAVPGADRSSGTTRDVDGIRTEGSPPPCVPDTHGMSVAEPAKAKAAKVAFRAGSRPGWLGHDVRQPMVGSDDMASHTCSRRHIK